MPDSQPPNTPPLEDEPLVQRVCVHDPAAIEELFMVRCGRMIVALSRQFHYEDLFNDFYLHLREDDWRRLRTWGNSGPLLGWMRSVAFRLCLEHVRREKPLVMMSPEDIEALLGHANPHEAHSKRVDLLRAIQQLRDPRQRYLLRGALEDRAIEALAEDLKITRAHADVLKSRAVSQLRELMCGKRADEIGDDDE